MKRNWILVFILVLLGGVAVRGATIAVNLTADKQAIARGGEITYKVVVTNSGGSAVSDLRLANVLSTGLDQWDTTYRRDGGAWETYPPNGIIPLGTLASGTDTTIEIATRVELSAPETVSNQATVFNLSSSWTSKTLVTNVLPWVDAGADKLVAPGGMIRLGDASAGDGGGGIASYSWSDNGGGGSFDDPTSLHPTYTAPNASSLITLTLTVTDKQGGQSSDSLRLWVDAFPTVDAGADKSVDEGKQVALADAVADDPDGWIASCRWSDGGAGGSFSPSAQVRNPTYTAPLVSSCAGKDITLTLIVTDHLGAQASDSLTLHVNNVNAPPTVNAGADKHVHSGATVTLTGQGSDPDGTIASYSWSQVAGPPVPLHGETTNTLTFTAPDVSSKTVLRFRLTVTDDCGASASDEAEVTVSPAPSPPPQKPASIAVEKQADRARASFGDLITYTYTVRNTGEATLYAVRLEDDRLGAIALPNDVLAPGDEVTASATTTVTVDDFPGPLVNTATVTARTKDGRTVTDWAAAQVKLIAGTSGVRIEIEALDAAGSPSPRSHRLGSGTRSPTSTA